MIHLLLMRFCAVARAALARRRFATAAVGRAAVVGPLGHPRSFLDLFHQLKAIIIDSILKNLNANSVESDCKHLLPLSFAILLLDRTAIFLVVSNQKQDIKYINSNRYAEKPRNSSLKDRRKFLGEILLDPVIH